MQINIAGASRDLTHFDKEPDTSRSTGRPLRRVELAFVTSTDAIYDQVNEELHGARDGKPLVDAEGTRWRVLEWSTASANGQSSEFTVNMVELEQVEVSRITFLGHEFDVDFYTEQQDHGHEGAFLMQAEIIVPAEQVEALAATLWLDGRDEVRYFDLVRTGVEGTPIRVRFGRILWQAEAAGARRFQLNFVQHTSEEQDAADNGSGLLINEPELSTLQRMALAERGRVRALVEELRTAGVLDHAAIDRIEEAAAGAWDREGLDTMSESRRIELFRA